jgi:hypothetical protein
LFSDIENKARRLIILKSLIATLDLGGEVTEAIQKEIEAAEEEAATAAAEAELGEGDVDIGTSGDEAAEDAGGDDLDLSAMPDSEIAAEGFTSNGGSTTLVEETLFEDDDLPTPEELDSDHDFTENH